MATMNRDPTSTTDQDPILERDLTQLVVREAVGMAMATPLREPILEAVGATEGGSDAITDEDRDDADAFGLEIGPEEEAAGEDEAGGEPDEETRAEAEKSRLTTFLQGATVFVVMFTVLYLTLRRLTGSEDEGE